MSQSEIDHVRAFLAQTPANLSQDELRAAYDGIGAAFPTPPDVVLETIEIGGTPAEWSTAPGAAGDRAILYLHGGGYVIGSIASHRHLAAALGRAAKARVLSLGYRLAPEHPFPAAANDALAGYRFLLESGFAPGHIAVAGDSAGGGLTVATLVAIRDAGLAQPACGFCISPWVDLEGLGASMTLKAAEDPMVQLEGLSGMASAYLAGASPRTPLAAPLHADLKGLAPLLIHVGSAETLLDDATRLAAAAAHAEVEVRLEAWPRMIHVWHFFHPMLTEGRRAIASAGDYISDRMDEADSLSAAA
ncbi:MAG TPA: alpha/beta hydrolase [Caulobacteraceae bacterium]|nr:alpha/beta hydrolase [Caulobacteraceae bacterium]